MKLEVYLDPPVSEPIPWSPRLRLAHDFHVPRSSRLFCKECMGDHALHYFHSGSGTYEIGGEAYSITARKVFLVRPGSCYRFRLDPDADIRMFNIHFDLEDESRFASVYPCSDDSFPDKAVLPPEWPDRQKIINFRHYEELFMRLLATPENPSGCLERKALLLEILALLRDNARPAGGGGGVGLTALRRALELVTGDPAQNWSLDELAKTVGISRSSLSAKCREFTGMTVQQYIRNERVNMARYLLVYSDLALKEIAVRCGFASIHHFTRIFKQVAGAAPGAFRSQHAVLDV